MKQFVVLCSEQGMSRIADVLKHDVVQFLEIQGMSMGEEGKFNVLVTPLPQPVEQPPELA